MKKTKSKPKSVIKYRIATYLDKSIFFWIQEKAKESASNESAVIRLILKNAMENS